MVEKRYKRSPYLTLVLKSFDFIEISITTSFYNISNQILNAAAVN